MRRSILSVGIDIGTTTTQVVFCRLCLDNTAGAFSVARIEITEREIIHRSVVRFTPLLLNDEIDAEGVRRIVEEEYSLANIKKEDVDAGAVIITGETARKKNAESVLSSLAGFAGDFVVATAGADLESILAGHGSGAAAISGKKRNRILNFDIGGGTTNAAVFQNGVCADAYALDIGGRLVRLDESGVVTYISGKINGLLAEKGITLQQGSSAELSELKKLTDFFALRLLEASSSSENLNDALFIGHGTGGFPSENVMFSGGVAEYIYKNKKPENLQDVSIHGDIGPLLGNSVRELFSAGGKNIIVPSEMIRATVIGAGNHSLHLSGSTVICDDPSLPKKNIPVASLFGDDESDYSQIRERMERFQKIHGTQEVAFSIRGPESPSYSQILLIASQIAEFYRNKKRAVVFIIENDFAKALGQTTRMFLGNETSMICLDGIRAGNGDYIDIGKPIGGTVPVVVKTLVFQK